MEISNWSVTTVSWYPYFKMAAPIDVSFPGQKAFDIAILMQKYVFFVKIHHEYVQLLRLFSINCFRVVIF